MKKYDIQDRTLLFAIDIVKLMNLFPKDQTGFVLSKQLIRSGTSIGANIQEADGASTRKDFFNKVSISRKEARETKYWLNLVLHSNIINNPENVLEINRLKDECSQLIKILSAIISKNITNEES